MAFLSPIFGLRPVEVESLAFAQLLLELVMGFRSKFRGLGLRGSSGPVRLNESNHTVDNCTLFLVGWSQRCPFLQPQNCFLLHFGSRHLLLGYPRELSLHAHGVVSNYRRLAHIC